MRWATARRGAPVAALHARRPVLVSLASSVIVVLAVLGVLIASSGGVGPPGLCLVAAAGVGVVAFLLGAGRRRTGRALAREEARQAAMSSVSREWACVIDRGGVVVAARVSDPTIADRLRRGVVGTDGLHLVAHDDRDAVCAAIADARAGRAHPVVIRARTERGWRWAELTFVDRTEDPTVCGLVIGVRGVTRLVQRDHCRDCLFAGSADLAATATPQDALHVLTQIITAATGADAGWIRLVEARGGRPQLGPRRSLVLGGGAGWSGPSGCSADPAAAAGPDVEALTAELDPTGQAIAGDDEGPEAAAARSGTTVHGEPVADDLDPRPGLLALPITASGSTMGVLALRFAGPSRLRLDGTVIAAASSFTRLAAVVVERALLLEEQRRTALAEQAAAARAQVLSEVTGAFSRSVTPTEVLEAATGGLDRLIEPVLTVALLREDDTLRLVAHRDSTGTVTPSQVVRLDEGRAVCATAEDGRTRWYGSSEELDADLGVAAPPGVCAGGAVPLRIGDEVVGVIAVGCDRNLSAAERELVEAVAGLCGEALRRAWFSAREEEAVRRLAELGGEFEKLFLGHPQPMLVSSVHDGTILAANRALSHAFGYGLDVLTTMNCCDLAEGGRVGEPGHARCLAFFDVEGDAEAGSGVDVDLADLELDLTHGDLGLLTMRRADGSTFTAELMARQTFVLGGQPAKVHLFIDQTRWAEAERARRSLEKQLMTMLEDTRRRLAAELHDGPVQQLSISAMRLGALRRQVVDASGDPAIARHFDQLRDGLEAGIAELRTAMFRLYPPALEELPLSEAIRRRIDEMADLSSNVEVIDRLGDGRDGPASPAGTAPDEIGEPAKMVLYRVAVEALNNVRKHARAEHVTLRLERVAGELVMVIEDDGVGIEPGIDPDQLHRLGHFGLLSMRNRIAVLGGTWSVARRSASGGTRVTVTVPWEALIEPAPLPAVHQAEPPAEEPLPIP